MKIIRQTVKLKPIANECCQQLRHPVSNIYVTQKNDIYGNSFRYVFPNKVLLHFENSRLVFLGRNCFHCMTYENSFILPVQFETDF